MKISRYKKRANACYSVYLDDGREFVFYEDVLIQSELLIKGEILEKDLEKIQKWNQEYDVYYVGLNSLKSKYRSTYELKEYLRKKEYPLDLIEKVITKLTEQGYLNDRIFAKSYIHSQMITTNHGPKRIEKDLMNKEIPSNIIQDEIEEFTKEEEKERIDKIITYRMKMNRTRAGQVLKSKIYNDLVQLGYSFDVIQECLDNYQFSNNQDLAKKEYEKYYRKFSQKYSGVELERKIREKLYLKGLHYEEE